jgi:hypothetical protein
MEQPSADLFTTTLLNTFYHGLWFWHPFSQLVLEDEVLGSIQSGGSCANSLCYRF